MMTVQQIATPTMSDLLFMVCLSGSGWWLHPNPVNAPRQLAQVAQWTPDIGLGSPLAWEDQLRRFLTLRRVPAYMFNIWDLAGEIQRWAEARRLLEGYLGADHVSYATRKEPGTSRTYVQNMATWLRARGG